MMTDTNEYIAEKRRLHDALVKAALDLFGHAKAAAFLVPVPNTSPQVYIVAGEPHQIKQLISEAGDDTG